MFTKITLRNYRTHKLTTIELQPVTLLIGNNNSGKSNLLAGIQHFSNLVKRGDPDREEKDRVVTNEDFFPHRYRLADENESISIVVEWIKNQDYIQYEIELYQNRILALGFVVGCRERISVKFKQNSEKTEIKTGYDERSNLIDLRSKLKNSKTIHSKNKIICTSFFKNFSYIFSYHFQPSFMKSLPNKNGRKINHILQEHKNQILIPSLLGYEGGCFQNLIHYIKENQEQVFSRFLVLMRRFESSFLGLRYDIKRQQLLWEFDLGIKNHDRLVDEFSPNEVSDGLIKAAAIGLLVSLKRPPALILIEEIENGINPGNIQELMRWIWQAKSPPGKIVFEPQFILTSHSPSVLREFHNHLNAVYTVRLNKRTYQSDVRNLNDALDFLIGVGTVEGEIIEDEKTGKRLIEIPQYKLADLWYSGVIG